MTTGEIIKRLREEKGMTQEQLANLMGYSHKSSVNKIELNKTDLPQSKLIKFAKIFNISPCELLGYGTQQDLSLTDQVKEAYGQTALDALALYTQLDSDDQGEIRGEMKQMLKASKYMEKDSWSARAGSLY